MAFEARALHKGTRFHVVVREVDPTNLIIISEYE
jgi:hypothetical protein